MPDKCILMMYLSFIFIRDYQVLAAMEQSEKQDVINAMSHDVINAISELKKSMEFPYHFLGGLSVLGLVTMGLYYYDQKYFKQTDSLDWNLRNSLVKFKQEMQQERECRTQIFNQQKQILKKQMRLERQVRVRLFKKEMDDLKLALQIQRNARLIEFNKQMEEISQESTQQRNNRTQLKTELQNIRKELKVQKENRASFNKQMQDLRKQLGTEGGNRQSFKAELQGTKNQIKEQRSNRIIFTNQLQKYTKEARSQRESFRAQLQSLRNQAGAQRNTRINFVQQIQKFTKEAKSEREGWKSELKYQFQSWKSENILYKKAIQNLLKDSWKQMESVRQLINQFKQAHKQSIKKDDRGRYAIIPFISSATWKGVKQLDGGYTWYCKDRPSSTGDSSPTSKKYNTQFSKMNNHLGYLNSLRGQTITVVPNVENLGESSNWNDKVLILDYRCHRFDRKNEAYLQILPFTDTNKSTRSVNIYQDNLMVIDCKETKQPKS